MHCRAIPDAIGVKLVDTSDPAELAPVFEPESNTSLLTTQKTPLSPQAPSLHEMNGYR